MAVISTKLRKFLEKLSNRTLANSSECTVLFDFLLTVKAATLIFISECGSAISSAKEGKSGLIYNLVKNK